MQTSGTPQETTGNNRDVSDKRHENGLPRSPVERPAFRGSDRYIRRSGYLTSSPVTVRPMIIRWISDVPSKIVKIFAVGQFPQVRSLPIPGYQHGFSTGCPR
jgi:hypothetical protein